MVEFIGEIIAFILGTLFGAVVRTFFIVLISGFTAPIAETFKEVCDDTGERGNKNVWVGALVLMFIILICATFNSCTS